MTAETFRCTIDSVQPGGTRGVGPGRQCPGRRQDSWPQRRGQPQRDASGLEDRAEPGPRLRVGRVRRSRATSLRGDEGQDSRAGAGLEEATQRQSHLREGGGGSLKEKKGRVFEICWRGRQGVRPLVP